jgi:hypothetical protein
MLAVLRRDGVLVPFAANDGKRWSASWSVPKYSLEAPLTFADIPARWWGHVPPATTWITWPTRGEPHAVHVTGPVVFVAHCLSNVGLRTDYRSSEPIPPPAQQHHPKDGVATTGNATVELVDVLDEMAPEWSSTLGIVKAAIERAELNTAKTADRPINIYGWPAQPAKAPLKLEVLCRSKAVGQSRVVYYFEAVREFDTPPFVTRNLVDPIQTPGAPRGTMRPGFTIFSQGFFVLAGNTLVTSNIVSTFTFRNREDVEYGLPLGTITVNGRVHWIMHWSGFGREHYTIIEVADKSFKKVLDVPGGAC